MKKIIINENQEKKLINEYADKYYTVPLFNYFNMNDDEKNRDLISTYLYLIPDFIGYYAYKYEDYNEYFDDIINKSNEYDDKLIDEILSGNYSFIKKDLINYLTNYANENYLDAPAWLFMENPSYVNNEWLIHFSDNAYDIAINGFKYGTPEYEEIAYSGAGDIKNKYGEGYDFAYLLDEFGNYYRSDRAYEYKPKYGSEAVIFRANGIRLYHYGDGEYQVIFWGPSAKDLIYIEYDDEYSWCIKSLKNGNILYYNEDFEKVADWAINNKVQYRKHMFNLKGNNRNKNFETNYG